MRNARRIAILVATRRGEAGTMGEILVLYYSRGGSVARLARQIARGIGEVPGMT
ncbi:NAD(P)H-quinone oxidoreductase, partial [Stenotrophomonas geniculata]